MARIGGLALKMGYAAKTIFRLETEKAADVHFLLIINHKLLILILNYKEKGVKNIHEIFLGEVKKYRRNNENTCHKRSI